MRSLSRTTNSFAFHSIHLIMKRTWHKVSGAFLIWVTLILFVINGSPNDNDLKSSNFLNTRTFDDMNSIWPRLSGLEISSLIDGNRADFNPWLDLDDKCGKFKTYFAKPDMFLPPVYLTSYPGLTEQL